MPYLEQLPYVGFKPTVPVNDAGCLIDPPVSVPIVAGVNFAANADVRGGINDHDIDLNENLLVTKNVCDFSVKNNIKKKCTIGLRVISITRL